MFTAVVVVTAFGRKLLSYSSFKGWVDCFLILNLCTSVFMLNTSPEQITASRLFLLLLFRESRSYFFHLIFCSRRSSESAGNHIFADLILFLPVFLLRKTTLRSSKRLLPSLLISRLSSVFSFLFLFFFLPASHFLIVETIEK